VLTGEGPVFQLLAAKLADDIINGSYPEESPVPSAIDFAAFYRMNPATASKGVNVLVDLGALYKRRGIGMFVAPDARNLLLKKRREDFERSFIHPLMDEAHVLGLSRAELHGLIDQTQLRTPTKEGPRE